MTFVSSDLVNGDIQSGTGQVENTTHTMDVSNQNTVFISQVSSLLKEREREGERERKRDKERRFFKNIYVAYAYTSAETQSFMLFYY